MQAAEGGSRDDKYSAGLSLLGGRHARGWPRAFQLLSAAAKQSEPRALLSLSLCYELGIGTAVDTKAAESAALEAVRRSAGDVSLASTAQGVCSEMGYGDRKVDLHKAA